MRVLLPLMALGVAFLFCGCVTYQAPVMPPAALLVTSVSAPLDTDMSETPCKQKEGSSSSCCILGLVSVGDASINSAAQDGGLSTIDYADYSYLNILYIFQLFTTKAYGK